MEPFLSILLSLSLFIFGNLFFCTRRHCKTRTDKDWNISEEWTVTLSVLLFLTPSLCLHLSAFLSPPPFLSGLTPDELVLQALSLRLFELYKNIWSYWREVDGQMKKKNKQTTSWKKNVWEIPNIFFDHTVTKSCVKVCGVGSSKTEGKQKP